MAHESKKKKNRDGLKGVLVFLGAVGFGVLFSFFSQYINSDTLDKSFAGEFSGKKVVSYERLSGSETAAEIRQNAHDKRDSKFPLSEESKEIQWFMKGHDLLKTDIGLGHHAVYSVKTDDGEEHLVFVNRKNLVVETRKL